LAAGTYTFKAEYNSTSAQTTEPVSNGSVVEFKTSEIAGEVKTCSGDPIKGAKVYRHLYGSNWQLIGETDSDGLASKELFDGTYKFKATYNSTTSKEKTQSVTNGSVVKFQTTKVTFLYNGTVKRYLYGSNWQTITSPMELFSGTYTFKFGTYQKVITLGECRFTGGLLTLLDHNGNGLSGGKAKWADGSWHGIPGETDANGNLLFEVSNPNFGKIAMTYHQGTIQQNRAALVASNYTWQTEQLRIWLHDHNDNPITDQGGKVDQGGGYWDHHGYTNSSGYLDVELFARSSPYKFRMAYNYTSKTQYPVVSAGGGSEVFKTQLAVVTLRENCTTKMIDGATVRYAAGSWRSFGTTGAAGPGKVTKELFPGNRKIRLSYNYRTNTITHDLTTDFDFVAVPLTIFGFNSARYAGGSWRTFTLPTMKLLPGKYKFRLDGSTQYITVDKAHCTQSYGCLTLLDQNGNGVAGGKAKPACGGSWKSQLSGQTDNDGKLWVYDMPACFTKIKMGVNGGGVEQSVAQLQASKYTWYTVPLVVELRDDGNALITDSPGGGKVDQSAGTWVPHGYTGDATPYGEVTVQVFPNKSYTFRMGYNHKSQTKTQLIGSVGGTMTFQTGKVIFQTAKSLSMGSWVSFPAGTYQFLPGTYTMKGGSTFIVTAGGTVTVP